MNKDKILTFFLLFFLFSNFSYARRLKEQDLFSWLDVHIVEDDVEREELLGASYRNGSPIFSFTNPNEVSEYLITRDLRSGEIIAGYYYVFKPGYSDEVHLDGNIFVALEYRGRV